MTDTDSTHREFPTVPLTRPIRRILFRHGFIDEDGNLTARRGRKSPPRRNTHQNLYTRSLELERQRRPRTATTSRRRRINTDDNRFPVRPGSPVPPPRPRKITASIDRTGAPRINPTLQRVPPKKTILLRLAISPPIYQSDKRCLITVRYLGPQSKVEYDQEWIEPDGDEIIVMQQHCGGENLVVFRSCVRKQGLFQFESRRHADFPLGLAFYINNIIVNRLSLCCEARCGSNQRIGGPTGAFLIVKMDKATPCRQCRLKELMRTYDERHTQPRTSNNGRTAPAPLTPSPRPPPDQSSPRNGYRGIYSPDFDVDDEKMPAPVPREPFNEDSSVDVFNNGGDILRPGSASEDPRSTETKKPMNSNTLNNQYYDTGNSTESIIQRSESPKPTIGPRGASPPTTDDRDILKRLPASPPPKSPSLASIKDVASDEENRFNQANPKNQTSSSDSTNGRVASPPWKSTTTQQPNRSTPSPSNENRGRRTSMDQRVKSPPTPTPRPLSPVANRNIADTLPSPIPRARDTPTNGIDTVESPQNRANYEEDFVASTAEDINSDASDEELKNIRGTPDNDGKEKPTFDRVDSTD